MATTEAIAPAHDTPAAASDPPYSFFRLPIVGGPLAGHWWIPASGGKVVRVLLGSYEPEQSALFLKHITPGSRLLDIGAAQGYYSLLAAYLAGSSGAVVAFEPDPTNAAYLRKHVACNGLTDRIDVRQIALGERSGAARFGGGDGTGTGRLCDEGTVEVQVAQLDDVGLGRAENPTHLKIDVEGGELAVLRGAVQLIAEARPTIFLSTHGPEVHRACLNLLRQWRYTCEPIVGHNLDTTTEVFCRPR